MYGTHFDNESAQMLGDYNLKPAGRPVTTESIRASFYLRLCAV